MGRAGEETPSLAWRPPTGLATLARAGRELQPDAESQIGACVTFGPTQASRSHPPTTWGLNSGCDAIFVAEPVSTEIPSKSTNEDKREHLGPGLAGVSPALPFSTKAAQILDIRRGVIWPSGDQMTLRRHGDDIRRRFAESLSTCNRHSLTLVNVSPTLSPHQVDM